MSPLPGFKSCRFICNDSRINFLFICRFIYSFEAWLQVPQADLEIFMYLTEDDLELLILLPLPSKYGDPRCAPVLFIYLLPEIHPKAQAY